MDQYIQSNRLSWDKRADAHKDSEFYDLASVKEGKITLLDLERSEVGNVLGKELLDLQCHVGSSTISWARLGAKVVGVDFSDRAIDIARAIAAESGLTVEFIVSNIYDLPHILTERFDIVYTAYGVLCWLPDINAWASAVAKCLKTGGFLYIADGHPLLNLFSRQLSLTDLTINQSYFHSAHPTSWYSKGSYAQKDAQMQTVTHQWRHTMGDIVSALAKSGLRIDFLHEYSESSWDFFPFMEHCNDGLWRMPKEYPLIPLVFSLKATKA